jgi:hypothetical protein
VGVRPRTFIVNVYNVRQIHSSVSSFKVVQAIQSAGVGVVGLNSRRTVVVLLSVDHQDVGETAVIRPDDTDTCGLYCLYYFKRRHRGMDLPDIVSDLFTVDLKGNEDNILRSDSPQVSVSSG